MQNIEALQNRLWDAADQLRSNSKLTSTEYCMPVLGLIFLRHAYNRYLKVKEEIVKNLPKRGGVTRPITKEDFQRKSALYLSEKAQYDYLLENKEAKQNMGKAIIEAMESIENDYDTLKGVLPKDYQIFDNDLLNKLIKIFNDEALRTASGDIFGRIYEYFMMKFAMTGMGEFFTPVSLVQTIVNVIEPDHGNVFDPACGSCGMFVQTSHFLENVGKKAHETVTFYGQEGKTFNLNIAKMNLAVHGLEGCLMEGNTFYEDNHNMLNKASFVMANPPFNVDGVDARKVKGDPRLPFDLPGVNKKGEVTNGNYLWISYFYSYLKENGRSGFVMSSQASSAGGGEKDIRRKIIETGHVDAMISIRSNFFYTRSIPCELWFFDKGKPQEMRDKILMIDARNIYRKVTRRIYDFSPEQLKNITAIVWLYRNQTDKYLGLIKEYISNVCAECKLISEKINSFDKNQGKLFKQVNDFKETISEQKDLDEKKLSVFNENFSELNETINFYETDKEQLLKAIKSYVSKWCDNIPEDNKKQVEAREEFMGIAEKIRGIIKQVDLTYKLLSRTIDVAEKELDAKTNDNWDARETNINRKELEELRKDTVEQLKSANYYYRQINWLQEKFPEAEREDIEGLVKLVDKEEIEKNDWSLTPGRYVGVAPPPEEDEEEVAHQLNDIHVELADLNKDAEEIAKTIQENFEELGI